MADNQNKRVDSQYNIFIANDIFPEADKIFSTKIKSLGEIKDNAFIVLDTNALLVPYNIGKESLNIIEDTYRLLTEQNRLIVPAQVAREFANNRARRISETFQQLTRKKNKIGGLQSGKYPLLESLDEYQDAIRLEKEIDDQLKEYKAVIDTVLDHIRNWRWNDPVSLIYENFFNKDSVYEPSINKEELVEDLGRRQIHKIPPGYKDASKDDRGIGDLLIWHTILEIGREHKVDIIFVSGDEKADWWHKSEGRTLYPRYELVDEFRRSSGGKSFHMTSFSQFLDLFGASKSIVQEIRDEENQLRSEESSPELVFDRDVYFLEKVQIHWREILGVVGTIHKSFPALLGMSKPIGFKGSSLILGFDYPIFKDKYEKEPRIDEIMSNAIESVLNVRGIRVKPVVTSEWPETEVKSSAEDLFF